MSLLDSPNDSSSISSSSLYISHPKGNLPLHKIRQHKRIGMVAAGSGITPMLSLIDYLIERNISQM